MNEALNTIQLNKELTADAMQLSGGEKQRIALARILLMRADVYLLDEPTSALDEATGKIVMKHFLEKAKQQDASVIMITHSKEVAHTFGEEIITLNKWTNKNGGNLS